MRKRLFWLRFLPLALIVTALMTKVSLAYAEPQAPDRVQDLKYGTVLFEYYQGHAFEALSALNVAQQRGGISGHGDHPALVEGGLMLSYGMTREAKKRFESLLLTTETSASDAEGSELKPKVQVSDESRNQAWFYLGKVLLLEQDFDNAEAALKHVDGNLLQDNKPELYNEWLYLQGQVAQKTGQQAPVLQAFIDSLPEGNIWQVYLRYNQALGQLNTQQYDAAIAIWDTLVADIKRQLMNNDYDTAAREEITALKEQTALSLGQLYLHQQLDQQALDILKEIRKDSVFSDQALFVYSVAASRLNEFGLALQALNTLKERALFTPWLQQIPYALAYLYEQLNEPELALQSYVVAAQHYRNLLQQLDQDQQQLSEQKILEALSLQEAAIEKDLLTHKQMPLALGRERIANDAYGYLQVEPSDFNYAALLATEPFQLSLRELHEIYKLKYSLSRWEQQLNSFDSMIATRAQSRQQRIHETVAAIDAQRAELWLDQEKNLAEKINQAVAQEDIAFFMGEQQIEFNTMINDAVANIALLPEGDEKQQFSQKFKRIKAYFSWWISEQYSTNRWSAEKQLIGLTRAIDQFKQLHLNLKKQIASNDRNVKLAERVEDGRVRLEVLKAELEDNLKQARVNLISQVREEFSRQSEETKDFLLAASEAQARLTDVLYQAQETEKTNQAPKPEAGQANEN